MKGRLDPIRECRAMVATNPGLVINWQACLDDMRKARHAERDRQKAISSVAFGPVTQPGEFPRSV